MTPEQKDQLRDAIRQQLADLETKAQALEEAAKPVALDQPIGRLSRMDAIANQALSDRVLAETRNRMLRLERALVRLDTDDGFGVCEACGEDISPGRLMAVPEAELCIHCAE